MNKPAANETALSPTRAQWVDPVCDRFEAAWKAGKQPRIEDFLDGTPESERTILVRELILVELHHRRRLGENPRPEDFLSRFPSLDPGWLHRQLQPRPASPPAPPALAPTPPRVDAVALLAALRELPLLGPAQMAELAALEASFPQSRALAGELLRRGWLTAYQANQLLQGRGSELVLGQYVLLERLGEGGMGQVFKARHRIMKRVVAVKLIRKQFLLDAETVRRFQQEIEAAAQLSHEHIVIAHDAGVAGDQHYIAMEYVEGTDLARLLGQYGPLPVAQACDAVRQAALGLHHAHECGLVHRDIKPHNLMRNTRGEVKVMDMGLARLQYPAGPGSGVGHLAPRGDRKLTQMGTVMGTADYIAPEQTVDSHEVDRRADIYSLGCTLYHLLTGRPPFTQVRSEPSWSSTGRRSRRRWRSCVRGCRPRWRRWCGR